MLKDLIKSTSTHTGLTQKKSRQALGIVLNAAERTGSSFTTELYAKMPSARDLAAKAGEEVNAAKGEIARLIEQTPGGRMAVMTDMIRNLQKEGLGHTEISKLFPAISDFCAAKYDLHGFGHLGDFLGSSEASDTAKTAAA